MKPFIIITGPQAVGKMAVGLSLRSLYNYRLFHNHMTIEFAIDVMGIHSRALVNEMRKTVFDYVADQDLEGFVFTYTWAFDLESDHQYINELITKFDHKHWDVIIVELESSLETRLKRNKTPLRLENKASKKNLEWSERDIIHTMENHRLNSYENEITHKHYLRINNEKLSPEDTAEKIYNYIQSLKQVDEEIS